MPFWRVRYVRCWGSNRINLHGSVGGQLGYGHGRDIGYYETPASAGNVNVGGRGIQLALGAAYSCALLEGGRVRCWGWSAFSYPDRGIGGDVNVGGTVTQITVSGGGISFGSSHGCALLDTGNVRCWGNNEYAQLGYGNTDTIGDDEDPVSAGDVEIADSGSGVKVIQIAAGSRHTCALLDTGKVRCWGNNEYGSTGLWEY